MSIKLTFNIVDIKGESYFVPELQASTPISSIYILYSEVYGLRHISTFEGENITSLVNNLKEMYESPIMLHYRRELKKYPITSSTAFQLINELKKYYPASNGIAEKIGKAMEKAGISALQTISDKGEVLSLKEQGE